MTPEDITQECNNSSVHWLNHQRQTGIPEWTAITIWICLIK